MELSEDNCTECKKHFKLIELTVVIEPKYRSLKRMCDKCLEKFKEETKDDKVCVEVSNDGTMLYCYRCGLKTVDKEFFKNHDCVRTETNIKFMKSLGVAKED